MANHCGAVLLLLCWAAAAAASDEKFSYIVTASKSFVLDEKYTIGVSVTGTSGIKKVMAAITTVKVDEKFDKISARAVEEFDSEGTNSAQLKMFISFKPETFDFLGSYRLNVSIETFDGTKFSNGSDLSLSRPNLVTLVQTDKSMYQAGQLVKFRILSMDSQLRPKMLNTTVMIRDPQKNLIYKEEFKSSDSVASAVITDELQLSDLVNEGSWTIEVKNDVKEVSKTFIVQEYVLPKFSLDVQLPGYVHMNDNQFTVNASVSYTFDKVVQGKWNVSMGLYNPCRRCKLRYDMMEEFIVDATDEKRQFTFDLEKWRKQVSKMEGFSDSSSFNAKVEITFIEQFTGATKKFEQSFTIYKDEYNIKLEAADTPFFLPGFKVPVKVMLQRPNGQLMTSAVKENVVFSIEYRRRGKTQVKELMTEKLSSAPDGTGASVQIQIPTDADFSPVQIMAKIKDESVSTEISPFVAITNEFVSCTIVQADTESKLKLRKSNGILQVYVATIVGGQLQSWSAVAMENERRELTWKEAGCESCSTAVPGAAVVMLGVTASGEMVAADAKMETQLFRNNVTLSSNLTKNRDRPQEFASISISALPNSFVYLAGVDNSVNLLKTGHDITQDRVKSAVQQPGGIARYSSSRFRPSSSSVSTGTLLTKNELLVLSNGFYHTEVTRPYYEPLSFKSSRYAIMDSGVGGGVGVEIVETQVRKYFPETMLWTVLETGPTGKTSVTVQLPDTITAWDITAFAMAASAPIQTVAAPLQLVTFKKFFVSPVLPYSIVRGETLLLKVVAFNFLKQAKSLSISLKLNDGFKAKAMKDQESEETEDSLTVSLKPKGNSMAVFEVQALKLEDLNLAITGAVTLDEASERRKIIDIVQTSLPVIPEGQMVTSARTVLMSLDGNSSTPLTATVKPTFASKGLVEGSQIVTFSTSANVLGTAIENLKNLVELPTGCGEQNLAKFAPAVSVMEYLVATHQEKHGTKALEAMRTGYQRQLTFRRTDGSYSAFGNSDEAGSLWLTAFVLSTYAQAADFITIDPQALTGDSLLFVLKRQRFDGSFAEPAGAKVFDSSLQGDADSGSLAMTAFVCSALMDVHDIASARIELQTTEMKSADLVGAIRKCLWHLHEAAGDSKLDALDLALATFTLRQASDDEELWQLDLSDGMRKLRQQLDDQAVTSEGKKFWQKEQKYWSRRTDAIEATAYAFMDSLLQDPQPDMRVLKWLVDKRTITGGFGTTQATVVGLQAMTEFALKMKMNSSQDVDADVVVKIDGTKQAELSVSEDNKEVMQSVVLSRGESPESVELSSKGTGLLLGTVGWRYNVKPEQLFKLEDDWSTNGTVSLRLGDKVEAANGEVAFRVCAKSNSSDGMYIMMIEHPSGFEAFEHSQPTDGTKFLQRVEKTPANVVFYFNNLTPDGTCVFSKWQRTAPVLNTAAQQITLRKYYSPAEIVTAFHADARLKDAKPCSACPDCPSCEKGDGILSWFL